MLLQPGGIDVYYIDESHDCHRFVVTAIRIPILRNTEGSWQITWPSRLAAAKLWRRQIKENLGIPITKELHGVKLASGRGNYLLGKHNLKRRQAAAAYRDILGNLHMVPDEGILSATAGRGRSLYGRERLEAAMYALFQRMRRQCVAKSTNAFVFFDQSHPEYRRLYRMAQIYLPTGSSRGGLDSGASMNLPLDMFVKDGNEKNSNHCYFTQCADLIAYAAFLKMKAEDGRLTDWQKENGLDKLYSSIPDSKINLRVSKSPVRDGIVRLM
jgi:hypothetical protein